MSTPLPNEVHPALSHLARFALEAIDRGEWHLVYGIHRSQLFTAEPLLSPTDTLSTRMMHRRRCGGPAPYTGDPFEYAWDAMVDDLGRAIASDSRIEYRGRHLRP